MKIIQSIVSHILSELVAIIMGHQLCKPCTVASRSLGIIHCAVFNVFVDIMVLNLYGLTLGHLQNGVLEICCNNRKT